MLRLLVWTLVSLCCGCRQDRAFVITHVTVVDVRAGTTIPDQTIVVRGRHIVAVTPAARVTPPSGAEVLDGHGKYAIPGLWDMHVHLDSAALLLLLRSGVTRARDMGGDLEELIRWRAQIATGQMQGPWLVFSGPLLRGPRTPADSGPWVIRTAEQGMRAVDSLARRHVDFIKVHENLSRDAYFAIAREAHGRDIPFVGHVAAALTPLEVSDAGQKSIEHLEFVPDPCLAIFSGRTPAGCGPERFDTLLARLSANGTWLDPTIGSFRVFARQQWPAIFAGFKGLVPVIRAHDLGLLAGTDLGTTGIDPGASLHDELALLVDAGFTPAEALRAATLNPARFFGATDSLGTVEAGKLADLVLLAGDPLADIANTRRVVFVMVAGRH